MIVMMTIVRSWHTSTCDQNSQSNTIAEDNTANDGQEMIIIARCINLIVLKFIEDLYQKIICRIYLKVFWSGNIRWINNGLHKSVKV